MRREKSQILILIFVLGFLSSPVYGKLRNTVSQNAAQYGKEIEVDTFAGEDSNFTGYRTYSIDSRWKLTAFFRNGTVRSEHLSPKSPSKKAPLLNRSEVRVWAEKMFPFASRGNYRKKLVEFRAEGHFLDNGLIVYEYLIDGKKTLGFNGVKSLLYEADKKYWQINPKAYL